MIINGKKILVQRDTATPSGYRIFMVEGDDMKECYICKKDTQTGYWRVFMGNSSQARTYDVEFYYLHKLVYAYMMDWKSTDIQEGYHVHHILHTEKFRNDSIKYNDISNLIYIDSRTHSHLHQVERRIIKISMQKEISEEERKELSDLYAERLAIIKKYCAIRDNRMRKAGRMQDGNN